MSQRVLKTSVLLLCIVALAGCTFAGTNADPNDVPGFFMGIWHGLVAPYTLVVRWFIDIQMYALPNSGFGYDLGFLLGIIGSIPVGWLATLISIGFYLLS